MDQHFLSPDKAMKIALTSVIAVSLLFPVVSMSSDNDRQATQEKLDAECEAARELRLAPERATFVEECVERKQLSDRAACARFYRDYGAQSGDRAPLYYDLPECVEAFEFRRSYRRR